MKKIFKYTMIFLFFMVATIVDAQNSEYAVCKYPLAELATGNHANEIVNKTGMTGQQVYDMLNAYTIEFAGVNLQKFVDSATEREISEKHYNTQSFPKYGIQTYFDRTPSGTKKVLGSAEIKTSCCNIVGTDPGVINNFLKKYFSQKKSQSSGDQTTGPGKPETEKGKTLDTLVHMVGATPGVVTPGAGIAESQIPWGWILALVAVGLLIYFIAKNAAESARKADRKAIKKFEKMKNKSNENSAKNFVLVGNTLRGFHQPPAGNQNP